MAAAPSGSVQMSLLTTWWEEENVKVAMDGDINLNWLNYSSLFCLLWT